MRAAFHQEVLGMPSLCSSAGVLVWLGSPRAAAGVHPALVPEHVVQAQKLEGE